MKRLLVRRGAAGLALGTLALTGLAAVPAPASAAVESAYVDAYGNFSSSTGCTAAGNGANPNGAAWSDNGVAVSNQMSRSGTFTPDGGAAVPASVSSSATISSTPLGTSGPATITASGSASASIAGPACNDASATGGAGGRFTLSGPTWVTISGTSNGSGQAVVQLYGEDGAVAFAAGNRSSGSVTALLPAGEVDFNFNVDAYADGNSANPARRSASMTASFTVSLEPVGNGSAVAGKGKSYVDLGARDCATGSVAVTLNKKAVKKAKVVQIKVNGKKKGKKFQGKKLKKRTVSIAAPAASDARIDATITLKNGKKVKATRTYRAC